MKKTLAILSATIFLAIPARGQFYTQGNEPASTRWKEIRTASYRVIYPYGTDSLARVYARNLENVRAAVGSSIGTLPNGNYRRPMPVVLHALSAVSNGMVTWTPRRMELYTAPDSYQPESTTWEMQLAIHESRHISQMQLGSSRTFKWLKYPFGELVDGALAAVYGGPVFFEGDAVVAETALTRAGRGRAADFLEYQRVCFDAGQMRNYWQWLYGSLYRFTPDKYTIGYILNAGARSLYNAPDFTQQFYERIRKHHGVTFCNTQKTVSQVSGGKKFSEAFSEIAQHFNEGWQQNADSRAPFMESTAVAVHEKRFGRYSRLASDDGTGIWAVHDGMSTPTQLSYICEDKETRVKSFRNGTSRLKWDASTGRLYWSEYRQDPRWEMRSYVDIRYLDSKRKTHRLTHGQRYVNPTPSPDGKTIAVSSYPMCGGSAVVLLDSDGKVKKEIRLPDGMQALETAWVDDDLYLSAVTSDGIGIWKVDGLTCVLRPQRAKIGDLDSRDGMLLFCSDRNAVSELYRLDPVSAEVWQMTSTRHGAHDFVFVGDTLHYTMTTPSGVNIYSTGISSLPQKKIDFYQRCEDPIAVQLSQGEKVAVGDNEVEITSPQRYSKFAHLVKIHSWAPLFVDFDDVSSLSMDRIYSLAGLGATAFFQNELGTAYGTMAYHADPSDKWRQSGKVRFVYSGWYPVIEADLSINSRNAIFYRTTAAQSGLIFKGQTSRTPSIIGQIKTYIPFNFSSGGWSRGLVPQLSYSCTNDLVGKWSTDKSFVASTIMSRITASLRGYVMLPVAESGLFPRWGIGADLGYSARPTLTEVFTENWYAYVYGYVPGILPEHGIKLSGTFVKSPSKAIFAQETVNAAPRGFSGAAANVLGTYSSRSKLSVEYALPFADLDWSFLCPVAYIRNLEFAAHADYSFFHAVKTGGNLFSTGAELRVRLGNFLWVPYATRIGISYDYNGGSSFNDVSARTGDGHHSVGLVFSIDL